MSGQVADRNQNPARNIPWPSEWPVYRAGKLTAQAVVFALLGVASAVFAVTALTSTPPDGRGVIMAICAPLFLGMSALLTSRVRIRARSAFRVQLEWVEPAGSLGVVIPYSRNMWVSFCVMTFAMLILYGLIALAGWTLLATDGTDVVMLVLVLLASLAAVYILWFIIDGSRGKLARGSVALTPSGVYHRSWAFTSFFSWDKVQSVSPEGIRNLPAIRAGYQEYRDSKPHMTRHSWVWKQPEWKQAPDLFIIGTYLSVDPVLVYHTLSYYFTHPEQRAELGAEAGVERLRRADVFNH